MNLRKVKEQGIDYYIGLDLGTGSVGWAVTDTDGNLLHFKGRPTWGSRLFPSANTAAEARVNRGQRRRYARRRWRLDLLQSIFFDEMNKVDEAFFIRMNQSRLLKEDRREDVADYTYPFFNGADFTERDYYDRFPTIYHLRKHLMESGDKADLRLIYLALHNIVKTRGNFLYQDNPALSASNANTGVAVERLSMALVLWLEAHDEDSAGVPSVDSIRKVLESGERRADKRDKFEKLFKLDSEVKTLAKELSKAVLGYQADMSKVFFEEFEAAKFNFSNDEKVEEFRAQCPDEGAELFEAMLATYSAVVLMGILGSGEGTLSYRKVADYEMYHEQLQTLKSLVKEYVPSEYDRFFRGVHYTEEQWKKDYDANAAEGYTRYNIKRGMAYDDFKKEVEKLFADTPAVEDHRYQKMMEAFGEGKFLRRQKTSDNGSIPYQLHLEEMQVIIEKQGKYYPFLLANKDKIESLVTFRIPYYVGPLTKKNAPTDRHGKTRFAWASRFEGKENEAIKPWNWDLIIDKDKSAEDFIHRMTGTCTYIHGEPVLPKCSLLYQRYCVLNELNGARYTLDGDKWYRFDAADRLDIIADLFEQKTSVKYADVESWLQEHGRGSHPRVRGGQGESKFESSLSSHIYFCKLLEVDNLSAAQVEMVEEIILWNTLFEDRSILKRKLENKYGPAGNKALSDKQIATICKKRFAGWGRLSKKLLTEVKVDTPDGKRSIMDVLEEGNPFGERIGEAMVFMELYSDEHLQFDKRIDELNTQNARDKGGLFVEDLPGSPALKRTVNQAVRIVDEIISIAGHAPKSIFIENTRGEDEKKKGQRTASRYKNIQAALDALKAEGEADPEVLKEFKGVKPQELDDRLSLYFMQNGKCMYTGESLDIRYLSSYHIDHIIPQAYVKDDSFENRVLVKMEANEAKGDNLLISADIRRKMRATWTALHNAKLIGDKKFNNLMRSEINEKQLKGFIARQLVETSQIVKHVQTILADKYPDTSMRSIKASLSHDLREAKGFIKCREANDYHHAHDALLACSIGGFIEKYHPIVFDNPIALAASVRTYVGGMYREVKDGKRNALNSPSFMVGSFLREHVNKETGEVWDPEDEAEKIRKFLNYKDCFISRMPEITTGAFWDATIYSPKGQNKKLGLALKKGLDPDKYGSFSREQFAYFFIYKAKKGEKQVIEFAPVPVSVAAMVESKPGALSDYAQQLSEDKGFVFEKIVRAKVYKYQLIELDGSRLYITGQKEVRNANQLAFSQEETRIIANIVGGAEVADEDLNSLFQTIVRAYGSKAVRLGNQLGISDLGEAFLAASYEVKAAVLLELIAIANASKNMIDLSDMGGAGHAGCMLLTYSKIFSNHDAQICFIDQSVTGMFERQQKIEL